SLRGELDWIVLRALEKDRARRYTSASDLAEDIQRFLTGEPVEACPPSVAYRLRKYARRHRALLTTTALVLVTAVIGMIVSLRYAMRSSEMAVHAREMAARAGQSARKARTAQS